MYSIRIEEGVSLDPSGKGIDATHQSQTKPFHWDYTYEDRILHDKSRRRNTGVLLSVITRL